MKARRPTDSEALVTWARGALELGQSSRSPPAVERLDDLASTSVAARLLADMDPEYFKASMSDDELKAALSRFFEDDFGSPVPAKTLDRALRDPEKLYSLVLVVAAKCPRHEEYITHMMSLSESVQGHIRHRITWASQLCDGGGPSTGSEDSDGELRYKKRHLKKSLTGSPGGPRDEGEHMDTAVKSKENRRWPRSGELKAAMAANAAAATNASLSQHFITSLQEEVERLQGEKSRLEGALADARNELQKGHQALLDTRFGEEEEFERQLTKVTGEKAALERRIAEEKTKHEEETTGLRKQLEGKTETAAMVPGLERTVKTLREQVAEMDSLKERNRSLTKRVADFEQLVACASAGESDKLALETLKQENRSLKSELAEMRALKQSLQEDNDATAGKLVAVREELARTKEDLIAARASMSENAATLEGVSEAASREVLTRLERENETLREFAEAKEPGSSMLVTRIGNLQEENDRLSDALGKALNQVRQLEESAQKVDVAAESMSSARVEKLTDELLAAKDTNYTLKAELHSMQTQLAVKEKELELASARGDGGDPAGDERVRELEAQNQALVELMQTLKEQIIIREEETQIYRQQRHEESESQRKEERLLVDCPVRARFKVTSPVEGCIHGWAAGTTTCG
ncbi:hypothetical protein FOZ60_007266 [Perkinsus olseni]|uniref:Uncharacterized protein n=1 Tax=Perkinsus olseni TaxID=32597 RepID=A0A7J6NME6_PEROL|nr:hypothetical protein FOZ60_007266 [Perkinsus olseni]